MTANELGEGGVPPYHDLIIDPPWPKKKGGLRKARPRQGRLLNYETMPVDDIFALLDAEVFPLAFPQHNVWMWTIDAFLRECEAAMESRGYRRHARLVWDKTNGVCPAFTIRYSHEYLLWFYKPKLLPVAREQRGKYRTVLVEPAREHSRKPDAAYDMIAALYPDGPRIDVFSREARPGWDQWGDEVHHFRALEKRGA